MTNFGKQQANINPDPGAVVTLPRKPGRPPGHPKTGGRKPGSKNKITRSIKEMALPYGKRAFTRLAALLKSDDDKIALAAAKEILDRGFGKAVSMTEISGPDGSALQIDHNSKEVSDIALARRICFLLYNASKDSSEEKPALKASQATQLPPETPQGTVETHKAPTDTSGQGDNSNGHSTGLKNLLGHENKSEIDLGDQPLKIGFTRVFNHSDYSIRCDAGSRPGLPPIFTLIRRGDGVLRIGAWIDVLSMLRRLTSDELPPFDDEATVDTFEAGPREDELGRDPAGLPEVITASQRRRRRR